jgi:hypothetical protein
MMVRPYALDRGCAIMADDFIDDPRLAEISFRAIREVLERRHDIPG